MASSSSPSFLMHPSLSSCTGSLPLVPAEQWNPGHCPCSVFLRASLGVTHMLLVPAAVQAVWRERGKTGGSRQQFLNQQRLPATELASQAGWTLGQRLLFSDAVSTLHGVAKEYWICWVSKFPLVYGNKPQAHHTLRCPVAWPYLILPKPSALLDKY